MNNIENEVSKATLRNWERSWTNITNKLENRANKRLSKKQIKPLEYFQNKQILDLSNKYKNNWYSNIEILYSFVLNLTKNLKNSFIKEELHSWEVKKDRIISEIVDFPIDENNEEDILWWIYQYLLLEWEKNKKGSYYTPKNIIHNQIKDFFIDWQKVLEEFSIEFSVQLLGLIYKRNLIVDFLELQKLNKKIFFKKRIMFFFWIKIMKLIA